MPTAEEQKTMLLKEAEMWDVKQKEMRELERQKSAAGKDRQAKRYEEMAIDYGEKAEGYRAAIAYATGEYTTESLIAYAKERASYELQRWEAKQEAKPKMIVTMTDVPREVHTATGIYYQYPSGKMVLKSPGGMVVGIQQKLASQFLQQQIPQQQPQFQLPYQTRGTEVKTYAPVSVSPPISYMDKKTFEDVFGKETKGITLPIEGKKFVYVPEGAKKSTISHELGHYYSPELKEAPGETILKIRKEGEKALRLKYFDFDEDISGYKEEDYGREALAIAESWLRQGGIKEKIIRGYMPETVKFIEESSVVKAASIKEEQPVLYEKQIELWKAPSGEKIPITEIFYKEEGIERKATLEEAKWFREQPDILQASTEKKLFGGKMIEELSLGRAKIKTQKARGEEIPLLSDIGLLGVGFVASTFKGAQILKALKEEPVETIKAIPAATVETVEYVFSPEARRMITEEPFYTAGYLAGEYLQIKAISKGLDIGFKGAKAAITRISPSYKGVKISGLGEKTIPGVPSLKEPGKTFDIGLIPEKGAKLDISPERFVKEYGIKTPTPKMVKLTPSQKEILSVVKDTDATISGSLAQKILYPSAREFKDIDVVVKSPKEFLKELDISRRYVTEIKKGRTAGLIKIDEKGLNVDIAPKYLYEDVGGIRSAKILGYNIAEPEILLKGKVKILSQYIEDYSKFGKEKFSKALKDIKTITGKEVEIDLSKATLTGPYGYTAAEQVAYIGKTGPVTTSARGLFGLFEKEVGIKEGGLWATPFDIKTGQAMTRVTRLGVDVDTASFKDLLFGDVTFKRGKPQIVVFEKQLIGKDFKVPFKSSELEVTLDVGKVVTKKGKVGVTLIKGRGEIIPSRVSLLIGEVKEAKEVLSKGAQKLLKQKILSESELAKLSLRLEKETGISYPSGKPYYSPARLLGIPSRVLKVTQKYEPSYFKQIYKEPSVVSLYKELSVAPKYIKPPSYKQVYREPIYVKTPRYKPSYKIQSEITSPYYPTKPSKFIYYREPYYPTKPTIPPYYYPPKKKKHLLHPPIKLLSIPTDKKIMRDIGYDVFKIVKKKPRLIAKGLYRPAALDIGTREVLKDLKATFIIRKSDISPRDISTGREFERFGKLFRAPTKKSRYRKYGEAYVQRQMKTDIGTGRLTFRGEKKAIQEARMRKIMEAIK